MWVRECDWWNSAGGGVQGVRAKFKRSSSEVRTGSSSSELFVFSFLFRCFSSSIFFDSFRLVKTHVHAHSANHDCVFADRFKHCV